jgi:hypothetical protein
MSHYTHDATKPDAYRLGAGVLIGRTRPDPLEAAVVAGSMEASESVEAVQKIAVETVLVASVRFGVEVKYMTGFETEMDAEKMDSPNESVSVDDSD